MNKYTSTRTDQIANDSSLTVLGKSQESYLDQILSAVDKSLDAPFRMYANDPADAVLNIAASKIEAGNGSSKSAPPLQSQIFDIAASTINFQTAAVSGATFDGLVPFPSTTVGQFRRLGFTLTSAGSIKAIWSSAAASIGALANAGQMLEKNGVPIGYIDLEATASTAFKTAASASNIVENAKIYTFGSGGSGGASGSGSGTLLPEGGYKAAIEDTFLVGPTDSTSYVSSMSSASYNSSNTYYNILCDKSKTLSCTGTSYTLSAAPSFTMKVGDVIWSNTQNTWRRVVNVLTTTTGTLNEAFPTGTFSGAACMVSQAVYTVNLVNYGDAAGLTANLPFSTLFGAQDHTSILIDYRDSLAAGDIYGDQTSTALVAVSGSNSGLIADSAFPTESTFSQNYTRPVFPNRIDDMGLLVNTNKQRLFLAFFANPANGSVTSSCNLLRYKVSLYPNSVASSGGVLNSSYCMSNGSGTPNNCSNPTLVSGLTQVTLDWDYIPGLNLGKPDGDLVVMLEGLQIPRFYTGVTGYYYTEVDGRNVRLSADLSASAYSIHIQKRQGSIDTSSANTLKLNALYSAIVGSAAQVTSGLASHTTLTSAIAAISSGQSILVLAGSYTDTVTVNKSCVIEGQGNASIINGSVTFTSTYCKFGKIRVVGNLTLNAGANYNDVSIFWCGSGSVVTDNGTSNYVLGIKD